MSVAVAIVKIITDASIGSLGGISKWATNAAFELEKPNDCITVYDTEGGDFQPDVDQYYSPIQIRCRSIDYQEGYNKMREIFNFLHRDNTTFCVTTTDKNSVATSHKFIGIWSTTSIFSIGKDENERFIFTQNFNTLRELT